MSWCYGAYNQIELSGTIFQELEGSRAKKYDLIFRECANKLDKLKEDREYNSPSGSADRPFFEEFDYYNSFLSRGFKPASDLSFVEIYEQYIIKSEVIYSPDDMFKVALLILALSYEVEEKIWCGLGDDTICGLFFEFEDKQLKNLRVNIVFDEEESEDLKGNSFICSETEMIEFFSKPIDSWLVMKDQSPYVGYFTTHKQL